MKTTGESRKTTRCFHRAVATVGGRLSEGRGGGINSQHEEDTDRTCPYLLHSGMVWDAETSKSTSQPHFIAHYGGKEVFFILNY